MSDRLRKKSRPVVNGLTGPVLLTLATLLFGVVVLIGFVGATFYGWFHDEKTEIQSAD